MPRPLYILSDAPSYTSGFGGDQGVKEVDYICTVLYYRLGLLEVRISRKFLGNGRGSFDLI